MEFLPPSPGHGRRSQGLESGAGQGTDDSLAAHLKPLGTGLMVVHHQVRLVEGADVAKGHG